MFVRVFIIKFLFSFIFYLFIFLDLLHDIQAVLRCSFFPFSFYRHGIVLNQIRLCSAIMDLEPQITLSTSLDYYSKYSSTISLFT